MPASKTQGKPAIMFKKNLAQAGFTLVEVLVAMAILAISLAAASRAAGMAINHSADIKHRILADMVAQNQLALHLAKNDWLPAGVRTGAARQAGIAFKWKEEISPTPNPAFMKVVVTIYDADDDKHVLRRLTGFLVKANP